LSVALTTLTLRAIFAALHDRIGFIAGHETAIPGHVKAGPPMTDGTGRNHLPTVLVALA